MLAEGSNPFCAQGHLQPQQRVSAFVAFPEAKRGSPGLPSSFLPHHRRGTPALCSSYKCCNTHPLIPYGMCDTLSSIEWIDPPQNWAPSHSFGSLQQHMHSASLHPRDSACRNISCRMTDRCGDPRFHRGYLSRKRLDSTTHLASL